MPSKPNSYPRTSILHCQRCGGLTQQRLPDDGDTKLRAVCTLCQHIHYQNPHLIVGTLPIWRDQGVDKVLLCLRNIEPRKNKWTLPAGFMELGETTLEGALRETDEEAGVQVRPLELFSLMNVTQVGQVHLFYRAEVTDPSLHIGPETQSAAFFEEHEIPWEDLAFRTVKQTLQWYWQDKQQNHFPLHTADI